MRIALVAMNASLNKGGESARPLHYLQGLLQRGHNVTLYTHSRVHDELLADVPDLAQHCRFVDDTPLQRWAWRLGSWLPERAREFTVGQLVALSTQRSIMRALHALPETERPDVVHQINPISPRAPSCVLSDCPVVIGPLNGDIDYPPAFRSREPFTDRLVVSLARPLAAGANHAFPGKRDARLVLVSNDRTRQALPVSPRGEVRTLTANAVDLSQWTHTVRHGPRERVRFVFLGRLVRFKCVDLLLEAFASNKGLRDIAEIVVIGDGPQRERLLKQARRLGVRDRTLFAGWIGHTRAIEVMLGCDAFVFPSLQDPGGAVVMEACAMGLPVICADWAGPAEYLPRGAGLLIPVDDRDAYVEGLAQQMLRLARDPDLRARLGRAAREGAVREFGWSRRVEQLELEYFGVLGTEPVPNPAGMLAAG
ncbi:MAG: glycosyltransferase family 4 protein [Phycisphaerales bacterium JB040]